MSVAPEALAFLGRPPIAPTVTPRTVKGYAGSINEQQNQHTKEGEKVPRKPNEEPLEGKAPRRSPARTSPKKRPRFGLYADGSVLIAFPGITGTMSQEEAKELNAFLTRVIG